MSMSTKQQQGPIAAEELHGSDVLDVYRPGDDGYDEARATWNTAVEHRPELVAVPRNTSGVVEVVEFARRTGRSVAIQSTGHGPTRAVRGAVLVNMSRMNDVHLDVDARTVRIGGGAKWQAVLDVVTPHGLAPLLGSTPDVSAVGYTLGGGLGWLARKYGTSADSVIGFEVVAASGEVVRASADSDPELFWALRGAGAGHLGVVTSMETRLYPIAELYAGNLYYPAELAGDVLRRWRDWLPNVPDALTSAVTMINFPPTEDVPDELRGGSFVLVRGAFDGPPDEGERLLSHWRDWETPSIDAFGPLPFARIDEVSQDPLEPVPNDGTGVWLRSLGDGSIDVLTGAMFPPDAAPLLVQAELRHAGGALGRGSSEASAFGNRDALILLELVGVVEDAGIGAQVRRLVTDVRERIAPDLSGGVYLNYVEGDDRRFGVAEGIGSAHVERLASVKRRLDPANLFDHGLDVTAT